MVRWKRKQTAAAEPSPRGPWSRWLRRVVRVLLAVTMWVLLGSALLAAAILTSAAIRSRLLEVGLGTVSRAMPGQVSVGRVAWKSLGQVELRDLVWCDGQTPPDTLAVVTRLSVRLDMAALRVRDVRLDSLVADVRWLDAPAIGVYVDSLAGGDSLATSAAVDSTGRIGMLREGAIPGLPSLAVAHWRLSLREARLAPETSLHAAAGTGALEAGFGRQPFVSVTDLAGDLSLAVRDSLGTKPLRLAVAGLALDLRPAVSAAPPTGMPEAFGGTLSFGFRGPRLDDWIPALPSELPQPDLGQLAGDLRLELAYSDSLLSVNWDLDLGLTTGLDAGRSVGRFETVPQEFAEGGPMSAVVALDTLFVALPGLGLQAAGHLDGDAADLDLKIALADSMPLTAALPGLLAQAVSRAGYADRMPPDFSWAPASELAGSLTLNGRYRHPRLTVTADLDLGATPWLKTGRLAGRFAADIDSISHPVPTAMTVAIDALDLSAGSVSVRGAGHHDGTGSQGRLDLVLGESRLVQEFLPGFVASAVAEAGLAKSLPPEFSYEPLGLIAGRLELSGDYRNPDLALDLDLDLGATPWLNTGLLAGRAKANLTDLGGTGLDAATVELDALDIAVDGAGFNAAGSLVQGVVDLAAHVALSDSQLVTPFLPVALEVSAVSGDLSAHVSGTLRQPRVEADLQGGFLSPRFRVPEFAAQLSGDQDGGLLNLQLGGGVWAAPASADSASMELSLARSAGDSLAVGVAVRAWRGDDRLVVGAWAEADSLGRSVLKRVGLDSLKLQIHGQEMRLAQPTTLVLGPGPAELSLTPLTMAGDLGHFVVGGQLTGESVVMAGDVGLLLSEQFLNVALPSPYWSNGGGKDIVVEAHSEVAGTRQKPAVGAHLAVRLKPHGPDPVLGLDLDFAVAKGDTAGLQADLALVVADTTALRGRVRVPGRTDALGRWRVDTSRLMEVSIPEQSLRLAGFRTLLPPNVQLAGAVTTALEMKAPLRVAGGGASVADGSLTGHVKARDLAVRLPNRSRLELGANVKLSGSPVDPVLAGRVDIKSGFIRIPEMPRALHPVAGDAMLWSLAASDSLASGGDSLAVFQVPDASGPTAATGGLDFLPAMDLEIVAPGNLRLHGYGLDVELAGELKVGRAEDRNGRPHPRITGDMRTLGGTLQFMNRVFRVQQGLLHFAGAVPPNPLLDMRLEALVDGTLVRILVTGTATDPSIALESEPSLDEQDIMGVLLFGRPLSELDDTQRGGVQGETSAGQQLRQNLAGLAMVFGTAGLQNRVSSTLGVDMVEVGSGSAGDTTLMVGKYLNPRVMLKYHHSLEKSGTYFLTMEYSLSRLLRFVSTYGQGEEGSGLELKLGRQY